VANRPLIVDIKRYSFDDGPGIRSVIFFKGCPLKCVFCHNPETQNPEMEIAFSEGECIECGSCEKACDRSAIELQNPGRIVRDLCDRCGKCVDVCPGSGLRRVGTYYSVETLTEVLLQDLDYYRESGGGITLSGGEATMFPRYVEQLLQSLTAAEVHTVLETCGYFNYNAFRSRILPYLDFVFFDIKIVDQAAHKQFAGRPNHLILNNFRRLIQEEGIEVHPRIPLVPGITATEENISAIVKFLQEAGAQQVSLLPYNPMGIDKHEGIGRQPPDLPNRFMTPEEEEVAYAILGQQSVTR
jgi:pyruvate formate lyase activating enzyme